MRFSHIYRALKALGFSAPKAHEVLLDATRGDPHARRFVGFAFAGRR